MLNTTPLTGPREELSLAVVQGEGATEGLVGQLLLPDMPITRRTARLLVLRAADTQARRIIADSKFLRAAGTKYERLSMKIGSDTLTVVTRGVEIPVPYEAQMDLADYLDLENIVCGRLGNEISPLTKEYLRAQVLQSTVIFGTAMNSSQPYTVANRGKCPFITDSIALLRGNRQVGEPLDSVLIPGPDWDYIRQDPAVLAYIRANVSAGQKEVTVPAVLDVLREYGIMQVLIGDSYYNSGADGTLSYQQMYSNNYIGYFRAGKIAGTGDTDTGVTPDLDAGGSGNTVAQVSGVSIPVMQGIGVMTYWRGWAERAVPLPVEQQGMKSAPGISNMLGGNYVGIYWDETTEVYVARLKLSANPYIGNPNAGKLMFVQPNNSTGSLT